jgi:hypothetical protein
LLTVAIYVVLAYTGLFMIHQAASWILAWRTRRSLRGREARRVLGWCEMELDEWPLIVKTELMWYRIDLRAISHVVVQHRYAFVCVETGETYAIPLDRLPEQEEFRSFVAELRYAWENRHSGPPTEFRAPRMSPADERIEELR